MYRSVTQLYKYDIGDNNGKYRPLNNDQTNCILKNCTVLDVILLS